MNTRTCDIIGRKGLRMYSNAGWHCLWLKWILISINGEQFSRTFSLLCDSSSNNEKLKETLLNESGTLSNRVQAAFIVATLSSAAYVLTLFAIANHLLFFLNFNNLS